MELNRTVSSAQQFGSRDDWVSLSKFLEKEYARLGDDAFLRMHGAPIQAARDMVTSAIRDIDFRGMAAPATMRQVSEFVSRGQPTFFMDQPRAELPARAPQGYLMDRPRNR